MLYFSKSKIFLIFSLIFFLACISLSNFFNYENNFFKRKINLGLDLQGGSYLLLEVDNQPVITQKIQNKLTSIRKILNTENI